MRDEGLPFSIRAFIAEYIFSVEQLEILLLLASLPHIEHTVESVYKRILSARVSVEVWLNRLADLRIVEKSAEATATYRFMPASPEQAKLVAELVQTYHSMPVRVIEAIYTRRRVPPSMADPAQGFADAFDF